MAKQSSYDVYCGLAPDKAPRSMTLTLPFDVSATVNIDLFAEQTADIIEWVQGIYIDNSDNGSAIELNFLQTLQNITIPAGYQALLPVLCPNPPKMNFVSAGAVQVKVMLLTFPVPAAVWASSTAAAAASVKITSNAGSDGSGFIVLGGTAQNLFGGVTPTNGYGIYNVDASNDLWVSDSTTAAANNAGSIRVPANGGYYETPPNYGPIGAVSLVGAVTNQEFTARMW